MRLRRKKSTLTSRPIRDSGNWQVRVMGDRRQAGVSISIDTGPRVLLPGRALPLARSADVNSRQFAAADAAAAAMPAVTSLAKLLASHVLRDGEIVLLILRPSLWFVLLSCIQFIAIALVLTMSVRFMNIQSHATTRSLIEFGVSAMSARLAWGTLQWMSRLYILTDRRIISLIGVFQMQIFDCPLRKVVRTRLTRTSLERATGTGSIEIIPQDETSPFGEWKTIAHPSEIHEQIVATINRAKQGGTGCE